MRIVQMKSVPVFGGVVVPGAVQGVVFGEAPSTVASIGFLPQRPYVLYLSFAQNKRRIGFHLNNPHNTYFRTSFPRCKDYGKAFVLADW
jgi:hypothetical protein